MKRNWRDNIDPFLRTHLEAQLRETMKYRGSFRYSKDPANAQLWVAIANISKQLFNINVKLNYLERVVQDNLIRSTTISKATEKQKKAVKRNKKR
ncbi:MAG: hypothetical protein Q8R00_02935 [Candidatus Nanoarchaeia archaeon]|nr:hypothetical protein [Candidatus Nanoarchaeia archaeon]